MQVDQLRRWLDSPAEAATWLQSLGVSDTAKAHANLVSIASGGMTLHELADEYGISAERVRQIEVAALRKMRKTLEAAA